MRANFLSEKKSDLEEIILLASLCVGVSAIIGLLLRLPLPRCPFHAFTGIPCLSCGVSRALLEITKGNFGSAFFFNPLFCLFLLGCIILNLYALTVVSFDLPRLRLQLSSNREGLFFRAIIVSAISLNWLYLIAREQGNPFLF